MPQKLISQGAEAKIFLDKKNNIIIKDRVKKSYRVNELDNKIRKQRTKSEIKLFIKANNVINTPKVLDINDSYKNKSTNNEYQFKLQFIKGKKLSKHLNKLPLIKQKEICKQIGIDIAKLHDNNIIHGDLTTSNMILVENVNSNKKFVNNKKVINNNLLQYRINDKIINIKNSLNDSVLTTRGGGRGCGGIKQNFKIFFIDFGLGFIGNKIEDKAVDIHLLKQALEAKHFRQWEDLFKEFLEGYKNSKHYKKTIEQLRKVEKRGRYKG